MKGNCFVGDKSITEYYSYNIQDNTQNKNASHVCQTNSELKEKLKMRIKIFSIHYKLNTVQWQFI